MATLVDIRKQIADLEKQAAVIVRTAASEAAVQARALIERYELTAEDVGLARRTGRAANARAGISRSPKSRPAAAKRGGVPKYQDPKTGKTWTGVGKAPGWIAGAKNRDKFLISSAPATAAVTAPSPVDAAAAPKKAAKKRAPGTKNAAAPKTARAPTPAASVKRAAAKKAATRKSAATEATAPDAAVEAPAPGAIASPEAGEALN